MVICILVFFLNDTANTEIYTLSLHDALPIYLKGVFRGRGRQTHLRCLVAEVPIPGHDLHVVLRSGAIERARVLVAARAEVRSEEHTSELQSRLHLVCRLLLEKKKKKNEI